MMASLSSFARSLRELLARPGVDAGWTLSDSEFNTPALRLFELQRHANPDYRRWCDARGWGRKMPEHWTGVPAVPTSAFKVAAFSCLPPVERTRVFESSGTTADSRSRHYHAAESLALYEAALLTWFRPHLLPETMAGNGVSSVAGMLSLTPPPEQAPRSSLVHMLGRVARQGWFANACFAGTLNAGGHWAVDTGRAAAFLESAMTDRSPVFLAGTAFNFVHWLDALAEERRTLRLPPGSRVMETGGYKGRTRRLSRTELHRWIAESLSLPAAAIVTEYGMTELSSQAYDRVAGVAGGEGLLRFPPWTRVEVISPETGAANPPGEPGLLRVHDLANAFSVMAIETGDLAVREGSGVRLLGRSRHSDPRGCSLMAASGRGLGKVPLT